MRHAEHVLLVEGNDDKHSIIHVLKKRGVDPERVVDIIDSGGWDPLLDSIPVRLKSSAHKRVGVVADADSSCAARWSAICRAVDGFNFGQMLAGLPNRGFVDDGNGMRFGVWLMPNNQDNGALENFLLRLVRADDPVLHKSRMVVDQLSAEEKRFPNVARDKAVAHTYLAWQESPGRPLGMAVNCNYFDARAGEADAFFNWFNQLYS